MKNFIKKIKDLKKSQKVILFFFIIALAGTPFLFAREKKEEGVVVSNKKQVELIRVGDVSSLSSPLSLVGTVQSVNEAIIRSESSGQLTKVYKKVGDKVVAGETIAQFENSAERAQVLQAEGAYEQAKASRDIARINNSTSPNNLDSAKNAALNNLSSSYIVMDDAIRNKTDVSFVNARSESPRFLIAAPDQALVFSIENQRKDIERLLKNREERNKVTTKDSNLESELTLAQEELIKVKSYLDDLAKAHNLSIAGDGFSTAQIEAQKIIISGLRQQINGAVSQTNATKQALVSAIAANKIAGSEENPSAAASEASVKIAQGSYASALARLNKTVIRSSITGTVNSISIKTGDFVNQGGQIAIVSNNGALEVVTYVSNDDKERLSVGQEVILDKKYGGVITKIAEAIDPTNKKIEVKIGITDNTSELSNGQSVRVEIKRDVNVTSINSKNTITIPISAVKITPQGNFVFFFENGNLKASEVTFGSLLGEEVEIISGLTNDDMIIKDARGLKDKEEVELKSNGDAK